MTCYLGKYMSSLIILYRYYKLYSNTDRPELCQTSFSFTTKVTYFLFYFENSLLLGSFLLIVFACVSSVSSPIVGPASSLSLSSQSAPRDSSPVDFLSVSIWSSLFCLLFLCWWRQLISELASIQHCGVERCQQAGRDMLSLVSRSLPAEIISWAALSLDV